MAVLPILVCIFIFTILIVIVYFYCCRNHKEQTQKLNQLQTISVTNAKDVSLLHHIYEDIRTGDRTNDRDVVTMEVNKAYLIHAEIATVPNGAYNVSAWP